MKATYLSHTGAVRENNEDAIFCDPDAGLFIVADGIGGKEAGEIASATAVHIVAERSWSSHEEPLAEMLREAFYQANDFLYRKGKLPQMQGMGTTLTAVACEGDKLTIVHVGDSRVYLINDRGVRQLTDDHTLVGVMVREGKLTPEQARNHPNRNILVRAIGQDQLVEIDCMEATWHTGDRLLLCTDGLYGLVTEEDMYNVITRTVDLTTAATFLAEAAYNRGGYDNISLIIAAHD